MRPRTKDGLHDTAHRLAAAQDLRDLYDTWKNGMGDGPITKRTKVGLRERDQVPIESTTSKAGPNVRPTKACDDTPPNRYATEINLVAVKQWRHQGICGAKCPPIPVAFT